jgi:hypothetical protein
MLDTVTATLDQAVTVVRSLVDRDEFGSITGRPGLFTAGVIPVALAERDELGRRLDQWVPDETLL